MRIGILTISDRSWRGERSDTSGPALSEAVTTQGWKVIETGILPDEIDVISQKLAEWADSAHYDVIFTTGGTGFAPRDVTPEATRMVVERLTPGIDEAMRAISIKTHPHAMLSRAVSGIRKRTVIINLPGSPRGAVENMLAIVPALPHGVELLREAPDSEKSHMK